MGALALHVFCLLFFQNQARSLLWEASIAQWQSTGLVNQGSRVQSSLEALACMTFNLCFLNSTSWLKKASVGGNSVWNRDQILIVHTALQPLQKPKFTHSETWTRNLRFRRPTPYPLGHAGTLVQKSRKTLRQLASHTLRAKIHVRRPGIEPGSQEWESCMIPLHQRRHGIPLDISWKPQTL